MIVLGFLTGVLGADVLGVLQRDGRPFCAGDLERCEAGHVLTKVDDGQGLCSERNRLLFECLPYVCLCRACFAKTMIYKSKRRTKKRFSLPVLLAGRVVSQSKTRPAENGIFEPFIYKNDHFAKTGSGQT